MATEILKSFTVLQEELERAKDNLKGVDDHIKKLYGTGRDPNEAGVPGGPGAGPLRPGRKRVINPVEDDLPRGRGRGPPAGFPPSRGPWDPRNRPEGEPPFKRRVGDTRTVFSRLSGPPRQSREDSGDEGELPYKPLISSRVIATPKELPTRQEAMAAQSKDEKSKARNRRMFGALIGTLQKFRQEETQMKVKEEKRAIVEKKLEENAKKEKEAMKRERMCLFQDRKYKIAEIKKIELKMLRIKEQDEWETKNRNLLNFIQTRAKPHIFYLPKIHNLKTEERLVGSQKIVAKMIEKKRETLQFELDAIEKRGRWRQGVRDQRGTNVIVSEDENQEGGDADMGEIIDKENRLDSSLGDSIVEDNNKNAGSGKVKDEILKDDEEIDLEESGIILGEVDEVEEGEDVEVVIMKDENVTLELTKADSVVEGDDK